MHLNSQAVPGWRSWSCERRGKYTYQARIWLERIPHSFVPLHRPPVHPSIHSVSQSGIHAGILFMSPRRQNDDDDGGVPVALSCSGEISTTLVVGCLHTLLGDPVIGGGRGGGWMVCVILCCVVLWWCMAFVVHWVSVIGQQHPPLGRPSTNDDDDDETTTATTCTDDDGDYCVASPFYIHSCAHLFSRTMWCGLGFFHTQCFF